MRFPNSAGIYVIEGWFSDPFIQKLQEFKSKISYFHLENNGFFFFFFFIRAIDLKNSLISSFLNNL